MVLSLVTVIRLCWYLCFFLPFVQGQSPGNGFGGQNQFNPPNGGGGGGGGFGGVGNGFGNGGFGSGGGGGGGFGRGGGGGGFGGGGGGFREGGFRNGENNGFGNGRQGGFQAPQEGNQNSSEEEPTESETTSAVAAPAETKPSQNVAPTPSSAPPSTLIALVPSSTAVAPVSEFVPPQSSLRAAIPVASPSSSIVANAPVGSILTPLVPAPASTLMTAISSALTAPSAIPDSTAPDDEEVSAPATPEESSTVDPAPLSTSSGGTTNTSAQAGMGIGITFAVLSVAGAAGFYLWRRRQARKEDRDAIYPGGDQWKSFFGFNKRKDGKDDPEWSIESAEKVAILKGGSAKSVSTTRSDSRGSDTSITSPLAAPVPATLPANRGVRPSEQIMKVGMKVTQRPSNPALQSNPPSPPDIATMFPRPPSGSGSASVKSDKLSTDSKPDKETKTSSWPLPD